MGCGGSKEGGPPPAAAVGEFETGAAESAMPSWAQLNGRRGPDVLDVRKDAAGYVQYPRRQGQDAPTVMAGAPLPNEDLSWAVTLASDGYYHPGVTGIALAEA